MNASNKSTLVLFDEIGSGTEPNEGSSLAIAILEEFYQMGCITVASTHYGEIKNFADMHPEFENAGMLFDKDTLEPLYKLVIGKSEDSNALFISKKMGIRDKVLNRAKLYINDKNYNLDLVKRSKIEKQDEAEEKYEAIKEYSIGDKVKLIEKDDYAIVYKGIDKFNNIEVLYKDEFIQVNIKKVKLYLKASDLYPEGYDINSLFVSYEDGKMEKDIKRGSKKALKKIQKEIKNNKLK